MEYNSFTPQLAPFFLEPDNNSMSSNSSYYNSLYSSPIKFVPTTNESHRKGGRRPNTTSDLTLEEQGKVKHRREKNKLAAARCRKRRMDHTMELKHEIDNLEMERTDLENEISDLEAQKNELLLLFNAHQTQCKMNTELDLSVTNVKPDTTDAKLETMTESDDFFDFEIPVFRKLSSIGSFALPTATYSQSGQGLPFSTRSFNSFNFESLMQGGTGLTPQNSFIDSGKKN